METPTSTPNLVTLQEGLIRLIRECHAYDRNSGWVSLNRLWKDPTTRSAYASILTAYLHTITNLTSNKVLLCLDGIASSYGLLPIIGVAADSVGCRLAVWRELGDVTLTESSLAPANLPLKMACVAIQDAVARGSAILKVVDDLEQLSWVVTDYVCLVKTKETERKLDEALDEFRRTTVCSPDFRFHNLISSHDLRP